MDNPIKENRIVKDITFATRLLGFAEDVSVADACSEDEKESMISYATQLLKHQVKTAIDEAEINYLKRVGVWDRFQPKKLDTEDGYVIHYEDEDCDIYSCLVVPIKNEKLLTLSARRIREGKTKIKDNRVYFKHSENCFNYMVQNIPIYSEKELRKILTEYKNEL
jgi:hypothetical protein